MKSARRVGGPGNRTSGTVSNAIIAMEAGGPTDRLRITTDRTLLIIHALIAEDMGL